jgi:hypothetical protein
LRDLPTDRVGPAASTNNTSRLKSVLVLPAKLVLTGGMLLFVLRQVDLASLRGTFARMDWALLSAGLLQLLMTPFSDYAGGSCPTP